MSLNERAQQVSDQIDLIDGKIYMIRHLCDLVLMKHILNGTTIELSQIQKQNIISHYQTLKGELQTLVADLP